MSITPNHKRAFTDGSYYEESKKAGSSFTTSSRSPSEGVEAAIPTPNANNSYDAEVYVIWILPELAETDFNLNIYTDSKSAIDAIKNTNNLTKTKRHDTNTTGSSVSVVFCTWVQRESTLKSERLPSETDSTSEVADVLC